MNFTLNRPALQTAGQILNQQCMASAETVRAHFNATTTRPTAAPAPEDLILAAIADLVTAGRLHRLANPIPDPMHNALASAVANIFHLAAAYNIDLGTAVAEQLQYAVDHPASF